MRPAIALLLTLMVLATLLPRPALAATPLRQVDWNAVITSDPNIRPRPDLEAPAAVSPGPYVEVSFRGTEVAGHAYLQEPLYGDLDGDGAEEAVIMLLSGGTAGAIGFLLYREADPRPRLVAAMGGYKLSAQVENGSLLVFQAHYVGFEPNCCPSAAIRTRYLLVGDDLVAASETVEPAPAQEVTVFGYYRALAERDFAAAYAFLSPTVQAANPYDAWVAGYATTQRIEVETSQTDNPDVVAVRLRATDSTAGGGTVTRTFAGVWHLIWSPDQRRWLLDRAEIRLVS